jgi:hypothetical protein
MALGLKLLLYTSYHLVLEVWYALFRTRTLSISDAEGFLVISCGKFEYDKSS